MGDFNGPNDPRAPSRDDRIPRSRVRDEARRIAFNIAKIPAYRRGGGNFVSRGLGRIERAILEVIEREAANPYR